MSRLRAAKDWGNRPTAAVMMNDDYGHLNWVTGERKLPPGTWTIWDYLLANVFQIINDFTDQNGFLAWEVDDPQERMEIRGILRTDRAENVKQKVEKQNAKRMERVPGSYVALKIRKRREEDDFPTHSEYFDRLVEEDK